MFHEGTITDNLNYYNLFNPGPGRDFLILNALVLQSKHCLIFKRYVVSSMVSQIWYNNQMTFKIHDDRIPIVF